MSDPFAVAGSAIGVVSLGITICQGLVSYYQDFKFQDEEIQTAIQSLEDLAQTLEHLRSVLTRDSLVAINKPLIDHIQQLSSVDNGIKKLEETVNQCGRLEHQKNIVGRLQTVTQRLLYPFKKETIRSLQHTVAELRDNVSAALQALQL
jgi:archaellum component FlaC